MKKTIGRKTGRESEQFQLRLPDGMRKDLARVAEREGRSMNAVIVTALAKYLANEDASPGSKNYRLSALIETAISDLVEQMMLTAQHAEFTELIKKADAGELVRLLKHWQSPEQIAELRTQLERERKSWEAKAIALKAKK